MATYGGLRETLGKLIDLWMVQHIHDASFYIENVNPVENWS